jgi:hypothetical protein
MKSKFLSVTKYILILGIALFVAGLTPAHADTIFNISGTFFDGPTLTGTMSVNTATGVIDSASFTVTSPHESVTYTMQVILDNGTGFSGAVFSGTLPGDLALIFATSPSGSLGSLIGYTGGSICSGSGACGGVNESFVNFDGLGLFWESGPVTEAVATPEPATLALLAAGPLGLCLLARKHFHAAAA